MFCEFNEYKDNNLNGRAALCIDKGAYLNYLNKLINFWI